MLTKRISVVIAAVLAILLIPFIAMQYSSEVNWSKADFLIAGLILTFFGVTIEFILRKLSNKKTKMLFVFASILVLMLLWAEMAVGIFGSPIAGT